eukprot:gnl/TRDRNA2_/TRDRNA2_171883_c0_seq2.p1 gnl/TRDRNA2_/TRDRNA2_171883_c0~~gnl/TRDRNA2_/TRDRNA2_171883_c0_seq2.p1  ORF type:complete len:302 (-),score=55.92 gnl/TRDRNA2_/TRDRNA2_171883_c0_seq2:161-1066(-)
MGCASSKSCQCKKSSEQSPVGKVESMVCHAPEFDESLEQAPVCEVDNPVCECESSQPASGTIVKAQHDFQDVDITLCGQQPSVPEGTTSQRFSVSKRKSLIEAKRKKAHHIAKKFTSEDVDPLPRIMSATESAQALGNSAPLDRTARINLDEIGFSALFCKYVDATRTIPGSHDSSSEETVAAAGAIIAAVEHAGVNENSGEVGTEHRSVEDGQKMEATRAQVQELDHLLRQFAAKPEMLSETITRRRNFDEKFDRIMKQAAAQQAPMGCILSPSTSEASAFDRSEAMISERTPTTTSLAL